MYNIFIITINKFHKYNSTNTKRKEKIFSSLVTSMYERKMIVLKMSMTSGTSVGELIKLSGRESRRDAGSNTFLFVIVSC